MRGYPPSATQALLSAFNNFISVNPADPDAALILAFVLYNGSYVASTDIEYAQPIVSPAVFEEFMKVESEVDEMGINDMATFAEQLRAVNPSGKREIYTTATFKPSLEMVEIAYAIFKDEIEGVKDEEGIIPAFILQPITKDVVSHFSKNGGNALGISESDAPLVRKFSPPSQPF